MKSSKGLDIEKIKRKVEERKRISNEAFLDMMGALIELKKVGVKKVE
jgi:hypothetical protein